MAKPLHYIYFAVSPQNDSFNDYVMGPDYSAKIFCDARCNYVLLMRALAQGTTDHAAI